MRNEVPSNLDWVEARSKCSLTEIFRQLTVGVEQDVQVRNKLCKEGEPFKFTTKESTNTYNVYRDSGGIPKCVYFKLESEQPEITVRDSDRNTIFSVTVMLNDLGQCKPKVNGEERELWQVRRMALEKLFFETE